MTQPRHNAAQVVANIGLMFYLFTVGLGLDTAQLRVDLKVRAARVEAWCNAVRPRCCAAVRQR
jgi:hypothetical protein